MTYILMASHKRKHMQDIKKEQSEKKGERERKSTHEAA